VRELAYNLVENELGGATLSNILEELAEWQTWSEYLTVFKNALSEKLVIRIKRAEENFAKSSTYLPLNNFTSFGRLS
jgi:hypothetical protein